jgi:hypothetical protein
LNLVIKFNLLTTLLLLYINNEKLSNQKSLPYKKQKLASDGS